MASTQEKKSTKPAIHRTKTSLSKELSTLRINAKHDAVVKQYKPDPRRHAWLASAPIKSRVLQHALTMLQSECKHYVPREHNLHLRPKVPQETTELIPDQLRYVPDETKESQPNRDFLRSFIGDKHYRFRIGTVLNMSSNGSNAVNSTLSVSALQFTGDFISLSTVFNEFFVVGMHARWQPVSLLNGPGGPQAATFETSIPLGSASLHHGATAYSSLSVMSDNYDMHFENTGVPFTHNWINVEKSSETVLATQSAATQSWCTTGNVANYQGQLQFISQAAPPKLPVSTVIGTFLTYWDIIMRVRI